MSSSPSGRHVLVSIALACAVSLAAGYLLKAVCVPQDNGTYPPVCYSDVRSLYAVRGLDAGVVPYLDFPADGRPEDPGFLEYPVATGLVMWATSLPAGDSSAYLAINALILAAAALGSAVLLAGLVGRSAFRWAGAPLIVLYAFHNWDVLAVICVVAGCWMRARGRMGWAGAWFGVGAAAKLFPIIFLLPLVIEQLRASNRSGAARAAAAGILAALVPNAVVALANADGWWATYEFHSRRAADLGSVWGLILPSGSSTTVNVLSAAALAVSAAAILGYGWWSARRDAAYPFLPVASSLVAAFILWSKVGSPQYAIWLLPSLVLLGVRLRWWVMWNGVGMLVYLVSFGVGLPGYGSEAAPTAILTAGSVRAAALAVLVVVLVRASELGPHQGALTSSPYIRRPGRTALT